MVRVPVEKNARESIRNIDWRDTELEKLITIVPVAFNTWGTQPVVEFCKTTTLFMMRLFELVPPVPTPVPPLATLGVA